MATTGDFETFYSEKLLPQLEKLVRKSNRSLEWGIAVIFSILISIACLVMGVKGAAFIFVISAIFSVIFYLKNKNDFVRRFKETIINVIINFLNPGAKFKPTEMIDSSEYEKSGLFPKMYNSYWGEDLVEGVYKEVKYYCSELDTTKMSDGPRPYSERIFRGLFFAAEIKNINCSIYVWPEDDVQLPITIADYHFERFLPLPDIAPVEMYNTEFENYFTVYSNSGSMARTIISPEMMKRMVLFKNQIERVVRFSFVDGICYVAIAVSDNLLEPSLEDPKSEEKIKEYFFSILLILSIINQLDLRSLK
ncbi:MAG: DUF3137 domain-containing protein [Ginsengibacter sp.]